MNTTSATLLPIAQRFISSWLEMGRPADIRSLAHASGVDSATAWAWANIDYPKAQLEGSPWPFTTEPPAAADTRDVDFLAHLANLSYASLKIQFTSRDVADWAARHPDLYASLPASTTASGSVSVPHLGVYLSALSGDEPHGRFRLQSVGNTKGRKYTITRVSEAPSPTEEAIAFLSEGGSTESGNEKYTYSEEADTYVFYLDKLSAQPFVYNGDQVRRLVRAYSNYDGSPATVAKTAQMVGVPRTVIPYILRLLGKVHNSDPRTPEELAKAESDADIERMVAEDLAQKRVKYEQVFQMEDLKQMTADAEAFRRAEFTHQRRLAEIERIGTELARKPAPAPIIIVEPHIKGPHLLDLSIDDLHYGKFAQFASTGTEYNREIAGELFLKATRELIRRSSFYEIDKVLFTVGNDLFHVDNGRNETTHGTPQDVDGISGTLFDEVAELTLEAISMLSSVAPVDVLIMPGNHDEERTQYLGTLLKMVLKGHENVWVDSRFIQRKYYQYGLNLLGKAHGKGPRDSDLPRIMSAEVPSVMWAATRWREFHIHHLHMKEMGEFAVEREFSGTRIRRKPSLSGTDLWHFSKGYTMNIRAAEAHLYHHTEGWAGAVSFNL